MLILALSFISFAGLSEANPAEHNLYKLFAIIQAESTKLQGQEEAEEDVDEKISKYYLPFALILSFANKGLWSPQIQEEVTALRKNWKGLATTDYKHHKLFQAAENWAKNSEFPIFLQDLKNNDYGLCTLLCSQIYMYSALNAIHRAKYQE